MGFAFVKQLEWDISMDRLRKLLLFLSLRIFAFLILAARVLLPCSPGLFKIGSVDPVNVRLVMLAYIVLFLFHIFLSLHHE